MPKYELHILDRYTSYEIERKFQELIERKAKDGWRVHSQSIARYEVGYSSNYTLSVLLVKE